MNLGYNMIDAGREHADLIKRQLENAKTERELPYAKRDLISQIAQREATARYTDALTERSERTLDLDVEIKKADAQEKTQKALEFLNNKQYRDQANKLSWMTNEAKLKLAVENPETFQKLVLSADRYNNAKAAAAEYDTALNQEYSMLREYYNIAENAGENGNYEGANTYIGAVAKKYGRPVPEFLQSGFHGESLIDLKKAIENNVIDRGVAVRLAVPTTPGTMEERLINELPAGEREQAARDLLNKKTNSPYQPRQAVNENGDVLSNVVFDPDDGRNYLMVEGNLEPIPPGYQVQRLSTGNKESTTPAPSPTKFDVVNALAIVNQDKDTKDIANKEELALAVASLARKLMKEEGLPSYKAMQKAKKQLKAHLTPAEKHVGIFGWDWAAKDSPSRFDPDFVKGVEEYTDGQTAINPKTGERIIYRNGNWEKL